MASAHPTATPLSRTMPTQYIQTTRPASHQASSSNEPKRVRDARKGSV